MPAAGTGGPGPVAGLRPCEGSSKLPDLGKGPSPLRASQASSVQWECLPHRTTANTETPSLKSWHSLRDSYCHAELSPALRKKQEARINLQYIISNCINIPGSSLQSAVSPSGSPFVQPEKRH